MLAGAAETTAAAFAQRKFFHYIELCLHHRLDHHVVFDARSQINPCRTGSCITGHICMQAVIQNFDVNRNVFSWGNAFHFSTPLSRCAMRCINSLASVSLSARGRFCLPLSSNNTSSLSSLPTACCTRLPTRKGSFFARRFCSAYSTRFSLSAAKPTQNGGLVRLATYPRMSGLGTRSRVRFFSLLLILW